MYNWQNARTLGSAFEPQHSPIRTQLPSPARVEAAVVLLLKEHLNDPSAHAPHPP